MRIPENDGLDDDLNDISVESGVNFAIESGRLDCFLIDAAVSSDA